MECPIIIVPEYCPALPVVLSRLLIKYGLSLLLLEFPKVVSITRMSQSSLTRRFYLKVSQIQRDNYYDVLFFTSLSFLTEVVDFNVFFFSSIFRHKFHVSLSTRSSEISFHLFLSWSLHQNKYVA